MTREEVIEILKSDSCVDCGVGAQSPCTCTFEGHCDIKDAMEMAIKALEQQPSEDKVSLEIYKQVTAERDIAIEQLHELGYSFGEKIRTSDDCVSRQAVKDIIHEYKNNIDSQLSWLSDGVCNLPPVTPTFPEGATNGDMIKVIFPNIEANEVKTDTGGYIEVKYLDTIDKCDATAFRKNWWNAPYKRGNENADTF